VEKYGRARQATDDNIIWRMRFACWITNATHTRSEDVMLIAFPRQQWLHERASMLRYTSCIASLLFIILFTFRCLNLSHFQILIRSIILQRFSNVILLLGSLLSLKTISVDGRLMLK
jgi:hypothetical protein